MIDANWACEQLRRFVVASEGLHDGRGNYAPRGGEDEVEAQAEVVEQVFFSVFGAKWADRLTAPSFDPWASRRQLAIRTLARIEREAEVQAALGETAPTLSAAALHPWIWDSARSLWDSGHFREAVEAGAKGLNAYTQQKVGSPLAESDLFAQAFSDDPPRPDMPRLRPAGTEDDSKTAKSLRRGIRDYSSGCYAAIRNPKAHMNPAIDTPEPEALEQLAALSVLARWVDTASILRA